MLKLILTTTQKRKISQIDKFAANLSSFKASIIYTLPITPPTLLFKSANLGGFLL